MLFHLPCDGETWYLALSAALPALRRVFPLSTHRPADATILFSSLCVIYSTDCVSPAFVMHSSVPGHLGCSHALVLTGEAVARMVLFRCLPRRCGITGGVGSRVFCFEGTCLLFSGVAVSSLRCTQSVEGLPFLPALSTTDCARVSDAWCQPVPASDRFYLHFSPHFP